MADAVLTINDLDGLLCRALVQVAAGALRPRCRVGDVGYRPDNHHNPQYR
jgi:hypothetical protein